ncbi:MAG: hypothetical protein CMJ18_00535 [Phycisphaeraceae bacterium]|nr:hypothetical protein [Phycisphaeraceae bacterium]
MSDGLELFLDRHRISHEANLARHLCHPRKHPDNPVLVGEHPWETQYIAACSILPRDGGGYRMWYAGGSKTVGMHADVSLCYAESEDGYAWQRVMSDRHPYEGVERTNIVIGPETNVRGTCIVENVHDESGKQRYLALYNSYPKGRDDIAHLLQGIRWCFTATSPDGIDWSPRLGRPAIPGKSDSIQGIAWDAGHRRYIAYLRGIRAPHLPFDRPHGESTRVRYVRAAVSDDFEHWSDPVELLRLRGDEGDPERHYHQFAVTRLGDQYVALGSIFQVDDYIEMEHGLDGVILMEEGVCDNRLEVSRDGLRWDPVLTGRLGADEDFLERGTGAAWDSRWITTATQMLREEKRILICYSAAHIRRQDTPPVLTKIGVADLPRDRFQALRPRRLAQPGVLELKPLYLAADDLVINADAVQGEIRVELCDFNGVTIEGFGLDDCTPMKGVDSLDHAIRWRGGRLADAVKPDSLFQNAIRLRFYLQHAGLYAAYLPARDPLNPTKC